MKKISNIKFLILLILMLVACDQPQQKEVIEGNWIQGTEKEKIKTIEKQFRGMDKAMIEIGYRYQELYWGGQDENWEYATYQLKKIRKALILGLQRRPNRAESATHFLEYVIPEVEKAIKTKSPKIFNDKFEMMRVNCTNCHAAGTIESYPTFTIQIPVDRQSPIRKE